MKLSLLDQLANPLRADIPFGKFPKFKKLPLDTAQLNLWVNDLKVIFSWGLKNNCDNKVMSDKKIKTTIIPSINHDFWHFDFVELWNPKEMALFFACICRFGKRFELFQNFVSNFRFTKNNVIILIALKHEFLKFSWVSEL